ncbi:MAG: NAD(P)/FAD-dependent oxidoreductase [Bacteroidales bacterium]|nr:NAD(P)/FAD-dependent oxidoreductase [Bacteroidales bacterium]MCF8344668.1 NAD(P)/FAD-dependent oxidoreductase [Bacteroidales bacterium]MCF8351349.1 NAD(P)/FAD-dependent oxidoreductase [Bacteroidales bacterium]MCF8375648.1 NAD(P)/FAD-dependent oxidoreductase [Bacteroidales bacterium]MCF8400769.1 NAD(P)/FAD-dependent oxidoreductase [Bacteroidales bacterium]
MTNILIIGNGISGVTAARHIRKLSGHKITVISSETRHFYARTALMYIYMGHMKYKNTKPYENWFWKKNRINLLEDQVRFVNTDKNKVILSSGSEKSYDILIIASGSKPNKFGWPGQELEGVSGFYSYQDLQRVIKYTKGIKRAVIIGGGLIGVELAEMIHSANIPVTMLVREDRYWGDVLPMEEARLVEREIKRHHIDLRLNTELKEILPDQQGRVKAVITDQDEVIECGFVGLATGVHPNISWLKDSGIETEKGVLVDEYLKTNIDNVYAIGDCAQFHKPPSNRKAIEQLWYTGRMQAETLAQTICGNPLKYEPGMWFNSAKFFNIEYQAYGWVWSDLQQDEDNFFWEAPDGKSGLKMVFNRNDRSLKGINTFGIRMKQEVCENWIRNKISIDETIENIREAIFDPELSKNRSKQIRNAYQNENAVTEAR